MIGERVRHYQGKNADLSSLKGKIEVEIALFATAWREGALGSYVLVLEPSSITKLLSSEGYSLDATQRRELCWYTGGVHDSRKSEGIIEREKV